MKPIWNGMISFGLVSIPIGLEPATQKTGPELHMLDKADHERIKTKKVNEMTGREVSDANIVKGYMFNGDYVILDDEDFEEAAPEKTKLIEIENFIDLKDVDPIYFDTPYYAHPEKRGVKAYTLLRDVLRKSNKAGVGKFVLRTKEYVCLLRAMENVIVIQTLLFPEEVRPTDELKLDEEKISKAELDLAIDYIAENTAKFDVSKYHNTYYKALFDRIKEKAKGKAPKRGKVIEMKPTTTKKNDDLVSQLINSLNTKKKTKSKEMS